MTLQPVYRYDQAWRNTDHGRRVIRQSAWERTAPEVTPSPYPGQAGAVQRAAFPQRGRLAAFPSPNNHPTSHGSSQVRSNYVGGGILSRLMASDESVTGEDLQSPEQDFGAQHMLTMLQMIYSHLAQAGMAHG